MIATQLGPGYAFSSSNIVFCKRLRSALCSGPLHRCIASAASMTRWLSISLVSTSGNRDCSSRAMDSLSLPGNPFKRMRQPFNRELEMVNYPIVSDVLGLLVICELTRCPLDTGAVSGIWMVCHVPWTNMLHDRCERESRRLSSMRIRSLDIVRRFCQTVIFRS